MVNTFAIKTLSAPVASHAMLSAACWAFHVPLYRCTHDVRSPFQVADSLSTLVLALVMVDEVRAAFRSRDIVAVAASAFFWGGRGGSPRGRFCAQAMLVCVHSLWS